MLALTVVLRKTDTDRTSNPLSGPVGEVIVTSDGVEEAIL